MRLIATDVADFAIGKMFCYQEEMKMQKCDLYNAGRRFYAAVCGVIAFYAMIPFSLSAASDTELVVNGSFENYSGTVGNDGRYQSLTSNFTLDGWTISSLDEGAGIGITTALDTSIWKNQSAPKGDMACFFQKNASLSQTISVTKVGTYCVSFRYARRSSDKCYGNGCFYIEIDGKQVIQAKCELSTDFRFAYGEVYLAAGDHSLVVRHSNEFSTDTAFEGKRANSVIDALSITPKSDNLIFNGGCENYIGKIPEAHHRSAEVKFNADGWNGLKYGLSEASSPFLKAGSGKPFEGNTALHFNGVQEISQDIIVDKSGMYDIAFAYAPRDLKYYAGGRINVWIDDKKVGYVDCLTTHEFRRYMVRTHIVAGEHVFKLTHSLDNPVSADNTPCSAVDDVSIKVADNLIMNGSFDMGTVVANEGTWSVSTGIGYSNPGWTVHSGNAGLAKKGYPTGARWVSSDMQNTGVYSMFLQTVNYTYGGETRISDPVSVSQTLKFDVPGVYSLSFSYAARPYDHYVGGQIFARIRKGGIDGDIVKEFSVVATSKKTFSVFSGNVSLRETGEYTLEFYAPQPEHITTGENERDSVIDNVSLSFLRGVKGLVISVQ